MNEIVTKSKNNISIADAIAEQFLKGPSAVQPTFVLIHRLLKEAGLENALSRSRPHLVLPLYYEIPGCQILVRVQSGGLLFFTQTKRRSSVAYPVVFEELITRSSFIKAFEEQHPGYQSKEVWPKFCFDLLMSLAIAFDCIR